MFLFCDSFLKDHSCLPMIGRLFPSFKFRRMFSSGRMVLWVGDDTMQKHSCPWPNYHIEVPARLRVINQRIEDCELGGRMTHLVARRATEEEVEVVHTRRYIDDLKLTPYMNEDELESFCTKYEDIYLNRDTFNLSFLAAGCAIDLAKEVLKTKSSGFAAVRPPGHHASPDGGCGFCIFNNVALAAKHALKAGAKRVLIVDWDVHAGQGTQECVEGDDGIRLVSIHRYQRGTFWPNLQQSAVKTQFSNTVNVPLNSTGMGDADFLAMMQLVVLPMVADYQPDLIIVSCGFDAALGDPEGEMLVTPGCYGIMTRMLVNTGVPLAMVLEGGYFLESVAADTEYVIRALLGDDLPVIDMQDLHPVLPAVIRRVHDHYSSQYPSFGVFSQLRKALGSTQTDEEVNDPEFIGKREVDVPYATRGLYAAREPHVLQELREKLDDIVNAYTTEAQYKRVLIESVDGSGMSGWTSDQSLEVSCSKNLFNTVLHALVLPVNPLYRPVNPSDVTIPSPAELSELVKFLDENRHKEPICHNPIFQL